MGGKIGNKAKLGQRTGKTIACKVCQSIVYLYPSRIGKKKYCSSECARKDEFGFKPRHKDCVICGAEFLIKSGNRIQDKTCSVECRTQLKIRNTKKTAEKRKHDLKEKTCKECGAKFMGNAWYITRYCSTKCQWENHSKSRKKSNNPNYKGGQYLNTIRNSRQSSIHLAACSKYRKAFLKKHGRLFCEVCSVNTNGTMAFQVHHIYSASKMPRHKNLHDFRNLIMVCLECHHKFHAGKTYQDKFKVLEKDRGLVELFSLSTPKC